MQPRTTIWELEPHTAAKHEILRRYLQAWAPILSQGKFPNLVIVDGFAGPGRYSRGEEGSPIISIKAVTEQPGRSKLKSISTSLNLIENAPTTWTAKSPRFRYLPTSTQRSTGGAAFKRRSRMCGGNMRHSQDEAVHRASCSSTRSVSRFRSAMSPRCCALQAARCSSTSCSKR